MSDFFGPWSSQRGQWPSYEHTTTHQTEVIEAVGGAGETQVLPKIVAPAPTEPSSYQHWVQEMRQLRSQVRELKALLRANTKEQSSARNSADWALLAMVVALVCTVVTVACTISVIILV